MQNRYKNVFVDATVLTELTDSQIWTVLLNRSNTGLDPELLEYISELRELPNKSTVYKNP